MIILHDQFCLSTVALIMSVSRLSFCRNFITEVGGDSTSIVKYLYRKRNTITVQCKLQFNILDTHLMDSLKSFFLLDFCKYILLCSKLKPTTIHGTLVIATYTECIKFGMENEWNMLRTPPCFV